MSKGLGYNTAFNGTYDLRDDWGHLIKIERVDTVVFEFTLQFTMRLAGTGV